MAIGDFIKNNLALAAGIAVPVLLVFGFLVSAQIGRLVNDPPRHLAYFAGQARTNNSDFSLYLDTDNTGRITARINPVAAPADNPHHYPRAQSETLVTYDFTTEKLTETKITIPQGQAAGVFLPVELDHIRLTSGPTAPDGYSLTYGSERGGLIGDIFSFNYRHNYRARKGAARYKFNDSVAPNGIYEYYAPQMSIRFLGWSTTPNTEKVTP